jgi:hypothetical protein
MKREYENDEFRSTAFFYQNSVDIYHLFGYFG